MKEFSECQWFCCVDFNVDISQILRQRLRGSRAQLLAQEDPAYSLICVRTSRLIPLSVDKGLSSMVECWPMRPGPGFQVELETRFAAQAQTCQ